MYQRILVAIDGSSTSDSGLDEAIRLACMTHGTLRLLHVVDELSMALAMDAYAGFVGSWQTELRENGVRILEQAKGKAIAAGVEAETILLERYSGSVDQLVTSEAQQWRAEVIVLGTHGRRGMGRMLLGSSAEAILRHSTVPVLLVRAPDLAAANSSPKASLAQEIEPGLLRVQLPSAALKIE